MNIESTQQICALCGHVGIGKPFSNHLLKEHRLKSEEYTWRHMLGLQIRPACAVENCSVPVRYVAFTFKRYCKDHSHLAESEAGRVGGRIKKTWNRGATKETDERITKWVQETCVGENNHFFGKKHTRKTIDQISASKRLSEEEYYRHCTESRSSRYFTVLTQYSEYQGKGRPYPPLRVRCTSCNVEMERYLIDLERGSRCHQCFPVGSLPEVEIADFIRSLGLAVVQNTRQVIPPKEIDIWIPEKTLGIEHHGLYWHSGGKDLDPYSQEFKRIHRDKYLAAQEAKIGLIQFYSDEWRERRSICESIIKNRLGMTKDKIFARKLRVEKLSSIQGKEFFEASHLDGNSKASLYVGLLFGQEIVSAMSFRIPIQKKHGIVGEIARFANRPGWSVPGAASRLIQRGMEWVRERKLEGLLSYSDNRFGTGNVYEKCGFTLVGETGINYSYTDGHVRYDRFKYRAQPEKTEREVALEANVRPVYGPGHKIWLLKI